jgi:orotate phosphoribosyltransferase-like protein
MDDAIKDQVVDLYKQGTKTDEITAQTGVPRPTIYWILEQRGVKPSRTRKAAPEINVDQVLERLAASEREVGRLTEALEREKALNEALLERVTSKAV